MTGKFLRTIGKRIAPPRFLLFLFSFLVFAATSVARSYDPATAILLAFDGAALIFLVTLLPLLNDDTGQMRKRAIANDANRAVLQTIPVLISLAILSSVGALASKAPTLGKAPVVLVVGSLIMSWLFVNSVFTLHYAHLYYLSNQTGDQGGLSFPNTREPSYWDFSYFSFTLGMTFQTSDVEITGSHIRKVVLAQSMAAFIFNIGVIAFTVNTIGQL